MQRSAKRRVALLGLGHWYSAFNLGRALVNHPKAELVAAAWHNAAQLEEFARTFGITAYRDPADLLEHEDVDIIQIASPVSEIPELTIRAVHAGKHIVLGKPMAMTMAEADEMVAAVDAAGIVCLPFQGITRLRFAELKARIDRGDVGDIVVLHQTCRWSIAEDWQNSGKAGWFVDPAHVPGGAFIDEGIYWIEVFRWLAGSEVTSVDARMANLVHRDIAVEDWGMATLTFANGIIATIEASWTIAAPQKTGPSPKQNSVIRLEVVGSRGEIIDQWFRTPGRAVLAAGAPEWTFEPLGNVTPVPVDHLIECLETGRPPLLTIHDARRSFAVAMAAYQSAREGRVVELNQELRREDVKT